MKLCNAALLLVCLASGCLARIDALNAQLELANWQIATMTQKVDETNARLDTLTDRFDQANKRFESLEDVIKRSPLLAPPVKKPADTK